MRIKNETAKHFSQTVRMIGVAQFIHYGASAFNNNDWNTFIISGVVFLGIEAVGGIILEKGGKNEFS